jgi:hypothetical protein
MPHAEVAVVPGNHGGFNRIDEVNDRISAFIETHATDRQVLLHGLLYRQALLTGRS